MQSYSVGADLHAKQPSTAYTSPSGRHVYNNFQTNRLSQCVHVHRALFSLLFFFLLFTLQSLHSRDYNSTMRVILAGYLPLVEPHLASVHVGRTGWFEYEHHCPICEQCFMDPVQWWQNWITESMGIWWPSKRYSQFKIMRIHWMILKKIDIGSFFFLFANYKEINSSYRNNQGVGTTVHTICFESCGSTVWLA